MFLSSLKTASHFQSSKEIGSTPEAEEGGSHSDHAWATQFKPVAKQNQIENTHETCPVGFWDILLI